MRGDFLKARKTRDSCLVVGYWLLVAGSWFRVCMPLNTDSLLLIFQST
jgi:hypothetical protein